MTDILQRKPYNVLYEAGRGKIFLTKHPKFPQILILVLKGDYYRSYTACRENEKCQDQLLDCKLGRGKVLSEKEHLKLQAKRKKSETAVRKCDMEYYAAAIKSERSR